MQIICTSFTNAAAPLASKSADVEEAPLTKNTDWLKPTAIFHPLICQHE